MDRVRLGRALGYGTRHAAKTVAAVVEAASAPAPEGQERQVKASPLIPPAKAVRASAQVRRAQAAQVGTGLRELKRSVWQPLAVFSGALWLRVTGLFFGLIAFAVGAGAWRLRAQWRGGLSNSASVHFWVFVGVAGVFGYFAVSSFARATLKERRAGAIR